MQKIVIEKMKYDDIANVVEVENNSFDIDSGRGFTRSDRVRPDLAAPGVNVSTIYGKRTGSSFLTIDGTQFAFNTDALNYPGVTEKQKIFFTNASMVYPDGALPESVSIEALWTFNGSYSGVSIPVLHAQADVNLK